MPPVELELATEEDADEDAVDETVDDTVEETDDEAEAVDDAAPPAPPAPPVPPVLDDAVSLPPMPVVVVDCVELAREPPPPVAIEPPPCPPAPPVDGLLELVLCPPAPPAAVPESPLLLPQPAAHNAPTSAPMRIVRMGETLRATGRGALRRVVVMKSTRVRSHTTPNTPPGRRTPTTDLAPRRIRNQCGTSPFTPESSEKEGD